MVSIIFAYGMIHSGTLLAFQVTIANIKDSKTRRTEFFMSLPVTQFASWFAISPTLQIIHARDRSLYFSPICSESPVSFHSETQVWQSQPCAAATTFCKHCVYKLITTSQPGDMLCSQKAITGMEGDIIVQQTCHVASPL